MKKLLFFWILLLSFLANGQIYVTIRDTAYVPTRLGQMVFKSEDSTLYVVRSLTAAKKWYAVGEGSGGAGGSYIAGYGLSLSTNMFKVDTTSISTRAWRQKGIDSINTVLAANYYTQSATNALLAGKANTVHSHIAADISDFTTAGRNLISAGSGGISYNPATGVISWSGSSSGITSLNGLEGVTQTFATGTTGTDFNIASAGTAHTFNFPTASGSNRGLLNTTDWTTFNNKQAALSGTGIVSFLGTTPSYTAGIANQLLRRNAANTAYEFFTPSYLTSESDPLALKITNNLSDLGSAPTARTNLGGTTVGQNIFTVATPAGQRWIRINSDGSISLRSGAEVLSDIGALSSVPTIQQVLTTGNTINAGTHLRFNDGSTFILDADGTANARVTGGFTGGATISMTTNGGSSWGELKFPVTSDRLFTFPDSSGTIPLAVKINGTRYSSNSNGTIDLGTISGSGSGNGLNFYNSDSALKTNRTIDGNNKFLHIDSTLNFQLGVKKQLGRWSEGYGTYNTLGGYSYYDTKELAGFEATNLSNNSNFLIEAQGAADESYSKVHIYPDSTIIKTPKLSFKNSDNHSFELPSPTAGQTKDTLTKQSQFLTIDISDFVDGSIDDLYVTVESGDTVIKVREAPTTGLADSMAVMRDSIALLRALINSGVIGDRFDSIQVLSSTADIETATGNTGMIDGRQYNWYDSTGGKRIVYRVAVDTMFSFVGSGGGTFTDLTFSGGVNTETSGGSKIWVSTESGVTYDHISVANEGPLASSTSGMIVMQRTSTSSLDGLLGWTPTNTPTSSSDYQGAVFFYSDGSLGFVKTDNSFVNTGITITVSHWIGLERKANGKFATYTSSDGVTFTEMFAEGALDSYFTPSTATMYITIDNKGSSGSQVSQPKYRTP
jgi:hypothetical protein